MKWLPFLKKRSLQQSYSDLQRTLDLDYPSFSSVLPYRYFDEKQQLFINKHSIGFGMELSILSGADEKVINSLSDLLRFKLNDRYDLQCLLWGSPEVGEWIDDAFQQNTQGVMSELSSSAKHYYLDAAKFGFQNPRGLPAGVRDYRVFLFVSKKTHYDEAVFNELLVQREALEAELSASECGLMRLGGEFLSFLRAIINPAMDQLYRRAQTLNNEETLNEQVVDRSFECRHESDHLIIHVDGEPNPKGQVSRHETVITNLSIRQLPDKFGLWMGADNFFNIFRPSQAIRCPFLISMHLRLLPQAEAKNNAQRRFLGMQKNASTVYAKYIAGTKEAANEWKKIRDELASDEIRLVKTYFNVMLFSGKDKAKRDEASAIACFRYNGIDLFNTRYMQLQSYLATLPFCLSEGLFEDLKRLHRLNTLTTWNAANLLPLVGDYKLGRKGVPMPSFRNQIGFFDPFDPHLPITNHNIAVAATSGAGKSFLVQNLLQKTLNVGGRCFVIDMGDSYKKFCELVGGVYLTYENLQLNPFSHIENLSEMGEQIRDLLSVLASPAGELSDVQEEYLRKAAESAFETHHQQTNIDHVIDALNNMEQSSLDQRRGDLVTLLEPYSTRGNYGRIFNTHSLLGNDAQFVVLELGQLKNKPTLLKAVLFALILNIQEQIYQSSRDLPKMVVIDEAWKLLKGDNQAAARFIEEGYRTARRHHASFVTITQSINDYLGSRETNACWENSEIKFIMRQNAKAFDNFLTEHANYFDAYTERLIKGFGEAKANGYSEFLLQLGSIQTFHRLFVDPFSRVMFSSSGDEFAAVERLQQSGLSLSEAISQVAKAHYTHKQEAV